MLILSQNRELCADMTGATICVEFHGVAENEENKGEEIFAVSLYANSRDVSVCLGLYLGKERAKEILNGIVRECGYSRIFPMPEE